MADGSYTHKCRIGNWSEDYELEQLRMKDYLSRKSSGELLITKHQKQMHRSLQRVSLSSSEDGMVHFGDCAMLYSVRTQGVLANDIGDRIVLCDSAAFAVTTSTLVKGPAARNVYLLEPVDGGVSVGDVLHFGESFRIRAHQQLISEPMYIHSQPVSPLSASKYSRNQEVLLHPDRNYDTVWKVVHKDKSIRFEMGGEPVPANAEVLIVHAQTNQALSSDLIKYQNEFGVEYEVSAKTFVEIAKNQTMKQEFGGFITPDCAQRSELVNNHWAILLSAPNSPDPSQSTQSAQDAKSSAPTQESIEESVEEGEAE